MEEKTGMFSYERPDNDRRAVEKSGKGIEELQAGQDVALERNQKEDAASDIGQGNGRQEEEGEEEEEMTQERLQSLLEDIKLEGGFEDVEMTEERVNAILEQVRQAEKVVCSVSGWRSATSDMIIDSSLPGTEEGRYDLVLFYHFPIQRFRHQGLLSHQQVCDSSSIYLLSTFYSPSPENLADLLEQPSAQTDRQNGGQTDEAREGKEKEAKRKGSQEESGTAGPSRGQEEGGDRSQHKVQVRVVLQDRFCFTCSFCSFFYLNPCTNTKTHCGVSRP